MDASAAPPVPGNQHPSMPRSVAALLVRIDARPGPALEVVEDTVSNAVYS